MKLVCSGTSLAQMARIPWITQIVFFNKMIDSSDEFEVEFEMVICTNLLLRDHKNSSTVREIDEHINVTTLPPITTDQISIPQTTKLH
jgi:hypothetical protein